MLAAALLAAVVLAVGCGGADRSADPGATSTAPPASTAPIVDDEARSLLSTLADAEAGDEEIRAALARITAAGDERFAAPLIELLWARDIGVLADGLDYLDYIAALEALTGAGVGTNRHEWVEWYGGTEIEPPPGFTGWKGRLMSPIDLQFAEFLADGQP